MGDTALRIEHVSKKYRLGGQLTSYKTIRESLMNTLAGTARLFKGGGQHVHANHFKA